MSQDRSKLKTPKAKEFKSSPFAPNPRDPFTVQGADPSRKYKWINYQTFVKHGGRDIRGWQPLVKANATSEKYDFSEVKFGIKQDGLVHYGDLILAWMPLEYYNDMRAAQQRKTDLKTKNVDKAAKDFAKKHKIPVIEGGESL